jgi:hypothetical protein
MADVMRRVKPLGRMFKEGPLTASSSEFLGVGGVRVTVD